MKYWEIIADNLKKAGWSLGYVSAIDSKAERSGSLTRIAATESVSLCAEEKLTAFVELESAIRSGTTPRGLRARKITLDNCRGSSKSLHDFVIRQVSTYLRHG